MLTDCLKEFRYKNNLTQKQMAKKLKTSQSYYSAIETGRYKPGFSIIKRIARVLKKNVSEITQLL